MRDDCVLAEVGELGQRHALGRTPHEDGAELGGAHTSRGHSGPRQPGAASSREPGGSRGCPTGTLGFRPPEPDKSRVCCPSRPIGGVRRRREQ